MEKNNKSHIIINTDNLIAPSISNSLYTTRKNFYNSVIEQEEMKVSIFVLGYNRLEKTKNCVESILKYTTDIEYELILIDNGSTDGTLNYFNSVEYHRKTIIRVTKNMGNMFANHLAMKMFKATYYVLVANDVNVTEKWLSNLLKCYESDPKIGFVCPVSDNISNLQEINLNFKNFEEMQVKASMFNKSDPAKWEERLRLINIITVLKREVIDNIGLFDVGFFHDFGEDDYSARIRRAGYKLVLCRDTFVQHDHDFRNMEDKDPANFRKSLEVGRKNYSDKYWGLDGWEDINNYESNLINMLPTPAKNQDIPQILGIDVKCGTPILEVKNFLRKNNIFSNKAIAFTTQAKYYQDLLFVTEGNVKCDRIEYLQEAFKKESFEYIILGEPINIYNHPAEIFKNILELTKIHGKILFKIKNTSDIRMMLDILGIQKLDRKDKFTNIDIEEFISIVQEEKVTNIKVISQVYQLPVELLNKIYGMINSMGVSIQSKDIVSRLCIDEYLVFIEK